MSTPEPTVEVLAKGDVKTFRVTREGNGTYELVIRPEWTEPRVRDLDLAAWLGFARPRNIRRLIARWITMGKIAPQELRSTVERSAGRRGSTVVTEFWLTEPEALFVATRAETPKSIAVTMAMIDVFLAVRRGQLPAPPPPAPSFQAFSKVQTANLPAGLQGLLTPEGTLLLSDRLVSSLPGLPLPLAVRTLLASSAAARATTPERFAVEVLSAWARLAPSLPAPATARALSAPEVAPRPGFRARA